MIKFTTQFKLLCALLIIIGGGIVIHIKRESDYISYFHSIILPTMAEKSFFIGCLTGSKQNVQFCRQMRESYKFEIQRIAELKEDK